MRDRRHENLGFTMTEMLLVVAIIVILSAIGFVAIVDHMHNLKLTEMDNTAREIFTGAQNHLTESYTGGAWENIYEKYKNDSSYLGEKITVSSNNNEGHDYRALVANGKNLPGILKTSALAEILPKGAVDETVRSGGNYVIEYDAQTAQIYSVFYTDKDTSFDYSDVKEIDSQNGRKDKKVRLQYLDHGSKYAIGYYGDAEISDYLYEKRNKLEEPQVKILNEERLILKITDPNVLLEQKKAGQITMTVTVEIAGTGTSKTTTVPLDSFKPKAGLSTSKKADQFVKSGGSNTYYYILDSIVDRNKHMHDVLPSVGYGQDITVTVEMKSDSSNKGVSVNVTANSLFGNGSGFSSDDPTKYVAIIRNARHLENLSSEIAVVDKKNTAIKKLEAIIEFEKNEDGSTIADDLSWHSDQTDSDFFDGIEKENHYLGIQMENSNAVYFSDGSKGEQYTYYGIRSSFLTKLSAPNAQSIRTLAYFNIDSSEKKVERNTVNGSGGIISLYDADMPLTLQDLKVKNTTVNAKRYAGVLIGHLDTKQNLTVSNVEIVNPKVYANLDYNYYNYNYYGSVGGAFGCVESTAAVTVSNVTVKDRSLENENKDLTFEVGKENSGKYNLNFMAGGLAGYIKSSSLRVENAAIYAQNGKVSSNGLCAGGLIGELASNYTEIKSSFSSLGKVQDAVQWGSNADGIGGLIGHNNYGTLNVDQCYASGRTIGGMYTGDYAANVYSATNENVGGFIGCASGQINIKNSYSTCSVKADKDGAYVGGFVGYLYGSQSSINNCYSTGLVSLGSTVESNYAGSFIGGMQSSNNYLSKLYILNGINYGTMKTVGNAWSQDSFKDVITAVDYKELGVINSQNSKYPFEDKTNSTAYPYDSVLKSGNPTPYAFASTSELAGTGAGIHIGDWPIERFAGIVYYEKVINTDGTYSYYYNGYSETIRPDSSLNRDELDGSKYFNAKRIGTGLTEDMGRYVVEDGYAIILDDSLLADGSEYSLDKLVIQNKWKSTYLKDSSTRYDALVQELGIADSGYAAFVLNNNFVVSSNEYYSLDWTQFYLTKEVNNYTHQPLCAYYFTPFFADTICASKSEYDSINNFQIRSARQLCQLFQPDDRYKNLINNNYTEEYGILQTADIDFNQRFTEMGKPVTYKSPTLRVGFTAIYQGAHSADAQSNEWHTLKNLNNIWIDLSNVTWTTGSIQCLKIENVRADNLIKGTSNISLKNLELKNLFLNDCLIENMGTKSVIDNVTIENLHAVNGPGISKSNVGKISNVMMSHVEAVNGCLTANNGQGLVSNVIINDAKLSDDGFVGTNDGMIVKCSLRNALISGNGFVGTNHNVIAGSNIINAQIGKNGFVNENSSNGKIIDCHIYSDTSIYQKIYQEIESKTYIDSDGEKQLPFYKLSDNIASVQVVIGCDPVTGATGHAAGGFAGSSTGGGVLIAGSSVTGSVYGSESVGGFIHTAGSGNTLSSNYANVKLDAGAGSAGGFVYQFEQGTLDDNFVYGTITNCSSAGGFIYLSDSYQEHQYNYNALSSITANEADMFIKSKPGSWGTPLSYCYYLKTAQQANYTNQYDAIGVDTMNNRSPYSYTFTYNEQQYSLSYQQTNEMQTVYGQ